MMNSSKLGSIILLGLNLILVYMVSTKSMLSMDMMTLIMLIDALAGVYTAFKK